MTIVHSTWDESRNKEFPDVARYRKRWEELGFTVSVTPNSEIRKDVVALDSMFPQSNFLTKFDNLETDNMRFDFWRYAKLYLEGGVYADVDVEPLQGIREWVNVSEHESAAVFFQETDYPETQLASLFVYLFTNYPDNPAYATCVLLSPGPKAPLYLDILEGMDPERWKQLPEPRRTLMSVGPGHVTQFIKDHPQKEGIRLVGHQDRDLAYRHHGFGTWKPVFPTEVLMLSLVISLFVFGFLLQKRSLRLKPFSFTVRKNKV